jgi:hypothetical protein
VALRAVPTTTNVVLELAAHSRIEISKQRQMLRFMAEFCGAMLDTVNEARCASASHAISPQHLDGSTHREQAGVAIVLHGSGEHEVGRLPCGHPACERRQVVLVERS